VRGPFLPDGPPPLSRAFHRRRSAMIATRTSGKIAKDHLTREAIVYIRQSHPHQVRNNHESRARQYNLVERATALGWPTGSMTPADEGQPRPALAAHHRNP